MEQKRQTKLSARQSAYWLWYEYLLVALDSTDKKVRDALTIHKPFYAPWHAERREAFNAWWKTHGYLFEEKYTVRRLMAGETPSDPNALVIEVPLTQSPTVLTKKIKAIVQEAFDEAAKFNRKSKKVPTAHYTLTVGSEPKLDAVREMLTVYRDVYLKNRGLRGERLLLAIHAHYLKRRNKRYAKVPVALLYDPTDAESKARALRTMRRYISKAEAIVLNVARGQFPGRYE